MTASTPSRRVGLAVGAVALLIGIGGGIAVERFVSGTASDVSVESGGESGSGEPRILYWVAPMDPNYRRDGPGKSPMGMDLIPVYEGQEPGGNTEDGIVSLSPAMVQTIGVRTATVERAPLRPVVETFGSVAFDDRRTSHVHVRAEGWIERLHVRAVGEPVREGQVLFEMFAPELATAAWEYVRDLDRGDSRTYAGGRNKLLSLGVDPRQVDEIARTRKVPDRIKAYAPRAGVVVMLNVADGMYVTPEMTTVSITDPTTVWLLADVFESQAAFVFEGMEAEARVAGMPGRTWRGTVEYIYPDLRMETRTVQLRLTFPNPDLALKPNMYASVSLLSRPKEGVLTVPEPAVIRTGRSERIVLALGDGRFEAVPVRTGQSAQGRTEVLEGVGEGDRVVVSSHFLIDSESSLTAGFRQMEGADSDTPEPPTAARGRIEKVDAAAGMATVSHEPVPALGWPAMKMDFALDPALDRRHLRPGAAVDFAFVKSAPGTFAIVEVRPIGGTASAGDPMVGGGAGGEVTAAGPSTEAWALATVNGPVADGRVNVTHEPIPALGWPTMTMDLAVADGVGAQALPAGGRVRIGLAKGPDGLYQIVAAEPATGGS